MADILTWYGGKIFVKPDALLFMTTGSNITPRIYYEYPTTREQLIQLRNALNEVIGESIK